VYQKNYCGKIYRPLELNKYDKIALLSRYKNVIVKFGRFIPNQEKHYDEILGVELASPNQYAKILGGNSTVD